MKTSEASAFNAHILRQIGNESKITVLLVDVGLVHLLSFMNLPSSDQKGSKLGKNHQNNNLTCVMKYAGKQTRIKAWS